MITNIIKAKSKIDIFKQYIGKLEFIKLDDFKKNNYFNIEI